MVETTHSTQVFSMFGQHTYKTLGNIAPPDIDEAVTSLTDVQRSVAITQGRAVC